MIIDSETPREIAARWHLENVPPGYMSLHGVIEAHRSLADGVVYESPTAFIVARPVLSTWPASRLLNPYLFSPILRDAWFIWFAAGDTREMSEAALFTLPLVMFDRGDRRVTIPFKKLVGRLAKSPSRL